MAFAKFLFVVIEHPLSPAVMNDMSAKTWLEMAVAASG